MGQGGASPSPQPTSSSGEECTGTLAGNGSLISFEEAKVFATTATSNWTEVTLPWLMETMPEESHKSCTQSSWANLRGSLSVTHCEGQPATTAMQATTKAETLTTSTQEFMLHQPSSDSWTLCPLPGLWKLPRPCGGKSPWRAAHCQSSPAIHPKRP